MKKGFVAQYWTKSKASGKMMEQAMRICLEAVNAGATKITLEVVYAEAEKKNEKGRAKIWIDEVFEI